MAFYSFVNTFHTLIFKNVSTSFYFHKYKNIYIISFSHSLKVLLTHMSGEQLFGVYMSEHK